MINLPVIMLPLKTVFDISSFFSKSDFEKSLLKRCKYEEVWPAAWRWWRAGGCFGASARRAAAASSSLMKVVGMVLRCDAWWRGCRQRRVEWRGLLHFGEKLDPPWQKTTGLLVLARPLSQLNTWWCWEAAFHVWSKSFVCLCVCLCIIELFFKLFATSLLFRQKSSSV